ncbi:uncharacterized protein LOC135923933 [Gordionus sp. m RMFG-2023]|uniref:uncharacterized protein LOC135923933 n=1 Tax=Gordionus sp. m RMFG-2023 TaxID=3053472 RepID=UPI0031FD10E0
MINFCKKNICIFPISTFKMVPSYLIINVILIHYTYYIRPQGAINCECSTVDCLKRSTKTCISNSICYTQYVERSMGLFQNMSLGSVIKGCYRGVNLPIICHNKSPKNRLYTRLATRTWPVVACCQTEMCNANTRFLSGGGTDKDINKLRIIVISNSTKRSQNYKAPSSNVKPSYDLISVTGIKDHNNYNSPPNIVSVLSSKGIFLGVIMLGLSTVLISALFRYKYSMLVEDKQNDSFQRYALCSHICSKIILDAGDHLLQ